MKTSKSKNALLVLLCMVFSSFIFAQKQDMKKIPETAQQVKTGVFVMNIYDIDMSANSFYADFYVWFRWKGEIDPVSEFEFVNNVEKWGYTIVPLYDTI